MDRRTFLEGMVAGAAVLGWPMAAGSAPLDPVKAEIVKQHEEAVRRLQEWIRQPSIAAENNGMAEGCEMMIRLLREAVGCVGGLEYGVWIEFLEFGRRGRLERRVRLRRGGLEVVDLERGGRLLWFGHDTLLRGWRR